MKGLDRAGCGDDAGAAGAYFFFFPPTLMRLK